MSSRQRDDREYLLNLLISKLAYATPEVKGYLLDAIEVFVCDVFGGNTRALAVSGILELIEDETPEIRERAIALIDTIKTGENDPGDGGPENQVEGAAITFIEILRSNDPVLQARAAKVLGETHTRRGIEPLKKAIEDPDGAVREAAVDALIATSKDEAFKAFSSALKSSGTKVRASAAMGFGKLGDIKAEGLLIVALNDKEKDVQCRAAYALKLIGGVKGSLQVEKLQKAGRLTCKKHMFKTSPLLK